MENNNPGERRQEKPKNRIREMIGHMASIAAEINQGMKESYGVEDFLSADGSINMASYAKRNLYSAEDIKDDEDKIRGEEKRFTGVINESKRKYFQDKFGAQTDEEIIEAFMKEKAGGKSKQMEMIALSVLYKILKEEYIVVHSSTFDDYVNGMDNVLVNKETGDVICAFDEINNNPMSSRNDEKMEKVMRIAKSAGKPIKYGFTIKDKKIVERRMENLPVFMLSLKNGELDKAIVDASLTTKGGPTEAEMEIMEKFKENLKFQLGEVKKIEPSGSVQSREKFKDNLNKFEQFLERLEMIMAKHREISGKQ